MNDSFVYMLYFFDAWLSINMIFSKKINPDGSKISVWIIHKDINEPGFRWFNK